MNTSSKKEVLEKVFNLTDEQQDKFELEKIHLNFMAEVRDLMEKNGWNKADLARELGTSKSYITQLFQGYKLFNPALMVKIQKAFNTKFEIKSVDQRKVIERNINVFISYRDELPQLHTEITAYHPLNMKKEKIAYS